MPHKTDELTDLLDQVPGLKDWLRKRVLSMLSRKLLSYVAMALIGVGLMTPGTETGFVSANLETVAGLLLEAVAVLFSLRAVGQQGQMIQKARKAAPTATLDEIKTGQSSEPINWTRLQEQDYEDASLADTVNPSASQERDDA